jgi:hypothetical protein
MTTKTLNSKKIEIEYVFSKEDIWRFIKLWYNFAMPIKKKIRMESMFGEPEHILFLIFVGHYNSTKLSNIILIITLKTNDVMLV